jgi:molybdopterin-guanine dinucleotide biosynthesis protein A
MPSGFVLAGGRSSRMGRDKALLPFEGRTLVEHVAAMVRKAADSVALVGNPGRYASLGFPVIADNFPGCGPLAGIEAALRASNADWNLIVACDMPGLSTAFLRYLLDIAAGDCLLPRGPSGLPEPLCAVYHRRCRPAIGRALTDGIRKVTDGLAGLDVRHITVESPRCFANVNTPQEWTPYSNA